MRPSREYLQSSGVPEDPGSVAEHEAEVRQEINETERDPELERMLAKIDWDWLKQKLASPLQHTDIDPASLNFLTPERITTDDSLESEALYSIRDNQLLIKIEEIQEVQKQWQVPLELMFLYLIAHEEVHIVSKSECVGLFGDDPKYTLRTGYSLFHGNDKDESREFDTYTVLEEGLTDRWAREVVLEYLQAHPDFADAAGTAEFRAKLTDDHWHKKYDLEVSVVEAMIDHLAQETEVKPETVWNAMLRGKLEGEDLTRQDFQQLARQFFSKKFLEQLKTVAAEPKEPLKSLSLLKELNMSSIDPALRTRIEARIQAARSLEGGEELPLAA